MFTIFNNRIEKLKEFLINKNIDAFFISNFYNIFYLTGFKTLTTNEREAFILVTKTNIYLFTDERYIKIKTQNSKIKDADKNSIIFRKLTQEKHLFLHLTEIFNQESINSIGVETEDLRLYEYLRLKSFFPQLTITPLERTIIRQRAVKDNEEVEKIKKACEITDQCLKEIVPLIRVGVSEKQIAFNIEMWIKKKGFDLAFDPIVATGENSAIPHYNTKDGEGRVKNSSVILIDFGVKYENYLSDITRMFFIKPTDEMMIIYNKLLEIQKKTIDNIKRTDQLKNIDKFCRDSFDKEKLPDFPHSLGHGVGLEIHEFPKLSQLSTDYLSNQQVFTVEPGVYFEGKFGMRIEDTVVVENKKANILTKFSKSLMILP